MQRERGVKILGLGSKLSSFSRFAVTTGKQLAVPSSLRDATQNRRIAKQLRIFNASHACCARIHTGAEEKEARERMADCPRFAAEAISSRSTASVLARMYARARESGG